MNLDVIPVLLKILAVLERRRWLWPWMGAGMTLVVVLVAIWCG